jgi:hypothetical protein
LAIPAGSVAVVIARAGAIVIARFLLALDRVGLVESVTVILTVLAPNAVGVPLIAPVEAFRDRPRGNPVADHVYGALPPVAATMALYGVLTTPFASDEVATLSALEIVRDRFATAVRRVGWVESLTVIETVLVIAAVGTPLIVPVAALSVKPLGRLVADHV